MRSIGRRSEAERDNLRPRSYPPRSVSRLTRRTGFTLIELLVAITIIASLSALFLGASRAAMESSRASRTKSTISKLHSLLMEQWASYETRRVELSRWKPNPTTPSAEELAASLPNGGGHDIRLLALRELMKFEMPDRWSDIDLGPSVNPLGKSASRDQATVILESVPTLARIYYRRYLDANPTEQYEGAECLYMIIMYACGDGESRTMFTARDIGDVDEDGAPEFLDGWGNPISFVRWPGGFVPRSAMMSGDAEVDHDPFDPFRRNSLSVTAPSLSYYPGWMNSYITALRGTNIPTGAHVGFRLVPLIYSAGPDGEYEIDVKAPGTTSDPNGTVRLDPYAIESDDTYAFGTPQDFNNDGDDNSVDNIHNHLQDR